MGAYVEGLVLNSLDIDNKKPGILMDYPEIFLAVVDRSAVSCGIGIAWLNHNCIP